jgi:hypothetical protein
MSKQAGKLRVENWIGRAQSLRTMLLDLFGNDAAVACCTERDMKAQPPAFKVQLVPV